MNWWQNNSRKRRFRFVALLTVVLAVGIAGFACGPFFPRWLLSDTEQSVQSVPFASFFKEIAIWRKGTTSRFKTVPPKEEHSQAEQVLDADLKELREALHIAGVDEAKLGQTLKAHRECREKLKTHAAAMSDWLAEPFDWQTNLLRPMPELGPTSIAPGLPPEFADYMRGSIAYHMGKTNDAVIAWTELLKRPAKERHYRTIWAEYMMGRVAVDSQPEVAIAHFLKVRALVLEGFADSTGLAAASLGWEARACLALKDYRRAIALYSEQVSSGDSYYAVVSLRRTVHLAFADGEGAVRILAADSASRRVVTAVLISQGLWGSELNKIDERKAAEVWLDMLEKNQAVEVELAEQLALAAYQAGEFEMAQRWVNRAPQQSATTRWIHAKLLLRDGKMEEAAALLAGLVREFPVPASPVKDDQLAAEFLDRLKIGGEYLETSAETGRRGVYGEFGVLSLSRRDYIRSLDCLARGGYWSDAAYVAERVLTLEELKSYVDRTWPKPLVDEQADDEHSMSACANGLRTLLARRLARQNQWEAAKNYFSTDTTELADERLKLIATGRDPKRPAKVRAEALWQAAKLTCERGDALFETIAEPDWGGGNYYEIGPSIERRWQQQTNEVLKTSREELLRAADHEVAPRLRKHYLYLAADLAWQAAELMPAQSDATAKVLYEAGGWIKYRDPKSANRFYRALVLRCNKTELGAIAEKIRWFPPLDANGKPYLPKRVPHAKAAEEVESFPVF